MKAISCLRLRGVISLQVDYRPCWGLTSGMHLKHAFSSLVLLQKSDPLHLCITDKYIHYIYQFRLNICNSNAMFYFLFGFMYMLYLFKMNCFSKALFTVTAVQIFDFRNSIIAIKLSYDLKSVVNFRTISKYKEVLMLDFVLIVF